MKNYFIILLVLTKFAIIADAQVPLTTIVEHFTNTKCSVCASRNPGFYTNLNSTSGILHMSVHPSSPYATCPLSQQNTVDNDARTNYYSVYGGTPRLVINGDVIPSSTNYASASLFTPYQGLTSSFSLKITQILAGTDSIQSTVVIKKVAASALTNASLFIGLTEDTVFLNGGNGEPKHYNVLRKSASTSTGIAVALPSAVNDSLVVSRTSYINPLWNQSRMHTMAILQEVTSKKVIQSAKSTVFSSTTGILDWSMDEIVSVYPNPTADFLNIKISEKTSFAFEIFDVTGKMVKSGKVENDLPINIQSLENGIYALRLYNSNRYMKSTFCIQK